MKLTHFPLSVLIIFMFLIFPVNTIWAAYASEEFAFIPWGNEPHQLKIDMPEWVENQLCMIPWGTGDEELMISPMIIDDLGTPADSTDDDIIPGSGPTNAVVDNNENFIFASYDFSQLKGFDNEGNLIFNYSFGKGQYNPQMYRGTFEDIVVDSAGHIYVTCFPGMNYIPVLDYSGAIVDTLYPFGPGSSVEITSVYINPNGELIFCDMGQGFITYKNGNYHTGGSGGLISTNGSYYSVTVIDSITLRFNKYEDPDPSGRATTRQYTLFTSPGSALKSSYMIRGGNGDTLYVDVRMTDYITYEVWIFDLSFNLLDKLYLTPIDNQYRWRIPPFVAKNGAIYEFRVMSDGLQVIKWTKQ